MRLIKKTITILLSILTLTVIFAAKTTAADTVPRRLNYQGRLMDSSDNLLTGTYYICFSIWDNATVGSGSQVWPAGTPTPTAITTSNGVFSAEVGSADALNIDFDAYDYYLQVYVNTTNSCLSGGETLSPRQHLTSAAYSINADMLDGADAGTGANNVLLLNSLGDIDFDGEIFMNDGKKIYLGTGNDAELFVDSNDNLYVANVRQDKDISFQVNDGGVTKTPIFVQGISGKIGIWTSSPRATLDVWGNSENADIAYGDKGFMGSNIHTYFSHNVKYDYGSGAWEVYGAGSGTSLIKLGDTGTKDGYISFATGNINTLPTEVMRIDNQGYVGIGITNLDSRLHIKSTGGGDGLTIEDSTSTSHIATLGQDYTTNAGRLTLLDNWTGSVLELLSGGTSHSINATGSSTKPIYIQSAGITNVVFHTNGATDFRGGGDYGGYIANISLSNIDSNQGGSIRLDGAGAYSDSRIYNYNGNIILGGGNVGIGTTSPTAALHLKAGTATASTAPLKFTSGTNLTTPEAGAVEWDGSNLYVTQTSGPTRKTLAYTDSAMTGTFDGVNLATGTQGGIPYFSSTTQLTSSAAGTSGQALVSGGTGAPTWYAPTAGSVLFAGTNGILSQDNSNLFWNNTTKSLGIGTSPSYTLDVKGQSTITDYFRIQNSSSSNIFTISEAQANFYIPTSFNTAGDVEIAYDLYFSNTTASTISSNSSLYIEAGDSFEAQDVVIRSAGSGDVVIDSDLVIPNMGTGAIGDNVGFSSTSTNTLLRASSSRKYKDNIEDLSFSMEDFMRLRPVAFKWNNTTATPGFADLGLIAEEVAELFPKVATYENGLPDGVRYSMLGVLNINALQELKRQTDSILDVTQNLQEQINAIKTELEINIKENSEAKGLSYNYDNSEMLTLIEEQIIRIDALNRLSPLTKMLELGENGELIVKAEYKLLVKADIQVEGSVISANAGHSIIPLQTEENTPEEVLSKDRELTEEENLVYRQIKIENNTIEKNSRIMITATTPLCGNNLYVVEREIEEEPKSFTVKLENENICKHDIEFDWWMVEEREEEKK